MKILTLHLTYSQELDEYIGKAGVKQLFIYRHPADVICSYVNYVSNSKRFAQHNEKNRVLQDKMRLDFKSDEERFVYVFTTMKKSFNFELNAGWLKSSTCFAVKFEGLYTKVLALRQNIIGPLLQRVFEFLGREPHYKADELFEKIYGNGPTFSENTNKIG